ncbi:MAG TPA: DUF58 domain-containing protein [Gemmatimonadaceae bacterium]|nr:DUF58 domain-containing protein [Gemmatimonadaceae bacterium]
MADYGPLLEEVRRLRWGARRPVRGALAGAHPSSRRGTSAEFAEYRPYRQGDPLGRVDWKLFARTDRAYLRLSTDRTVLPTAIVVDLSASMDFPAGSSSKLERARQLAVGLSAVAHHQGDPVGVVLAGAQVVSFPPRTRGGVVGEIARLLDDALPAASADVGAACDAAARMAQRVVVASDMLGNDDAVLASFRGHHARGGEGHLVHVVAPEELEPAYGPVHDPERPDDMRVVDQAGAEAYKRAFAEWRDDLAGRCRAAGVSYTLSRTDQPVATEIRRIVAPPYAEAGG